LAWQEALETLKRDVLAAKSGDKVAMQRCVDVLGLGASASAPTAFKLVESRAIPSLRAAGVTLSEFYTMVRYSWITTRLPSRPYLGNTFFPTFGVVFRSVAVNDVTQAKAAGVALHPSAGNVDESAVTFAALVDQDGDGLLSFGEYMFFLTILASTLRCAASLPCLIG
jgi:hypothetical protein